MRKYIITYIFLIVSFDCSSYSQPIPGDVFREYAWIPDMAAVEGGKFLRVGGKRDYRTFEKHMPTHRHEDGYLPFGSYVMLDKAIRAEIALEKINSHDDTKGLRVSINRHAPIFIPESSEIPEPQSDYMYHTYPVTQIPLEQLEEGWENSFRLEVDPEQRWGWPQHLINGVILRVYYQPDAFAKKASVTGVLAGDSLGERVMLSIDNSNMNVRRVEYIGLYEGINYEGDGVYRQWHYHYFKGALMHHIGSNNHFPYSVEWDTSWIPDQEKEIKVAARVMDNSGLIYFTEAVEGLTLDRKYKVELCKPYEQPANWVNRHQVFEMKTDLAGNPDNIVEARLFWNSWSPCYGAGVYVNDVKVWDADGPCYDYMAVEVALEDPLVLNPGVNVIKTGEKPDHNGKRVYGMAVQWPGIMMLVKYR